MIRLHGRLFTLLCLQRDLWWGRSWREQGEGVVGGDSAQSRVQDPGGGGWTVPPGVEEEEEQRLEQEGRQSSLPVLSGNSTPGQSI